MSDENSSMPELEVMKSYANHLKTLLQRPERQIVYFLKREHFITSDLHKDILEVRSPLTAREKSSKLVDAIINAIAQDKSLFKVFVDKLKKSGVFYQATVKKLTDELSRLSG